MIGIVLSVLVLLASFVFWVANPVLFMRLQLNSLDPPPDAEFIGRWKSLEGGGWALYDEYVTELGIEEACEQFRSALIDWGAEQWDYQALGGFAPNPDRCRYSFGRRSLWSLFQERDVYLSVTSTDVYPNEDVESRPGPFGYRPAFDLRGRDTIIIIKMDT